jgi:predicted dehydrogenase
MDSINRRKFLKKSTIVTAGMVFGAPVIKKAWAQRSPNETINIAVVGFNGRGRSHYQSFARIPNVKVAALCDIDENLFPAAVASVEKIGGYKPRTVVDFRDLLDDKDIDAVSIATPDHWHALMTIWACQAGKDVYVEKPASYNILEGRKAVQAARKYNRVVQVGTQGRSSQGNREAMQFLHEGKLGNIYMAKGLCFKPRENIGYKKDSPIPNGVHWDQFLGPASYRPFNENRFKYNWHYFWDTGTTDMGNQGSHQMDATRWGMNKRVHPVKIHGTGNYYVYKSDEETPNTQISTFEYEDGKILQFEVRGLYTNDEAGVLIGNIFYGSEGWMTIGGGGGIKTFLGPKNEPGPVFGGKREQKADVKDITGGEGGDHWTNFLDCMRTRKWQDLTADIEEGHMSAALCHLGNISYRTGRKLTFNPYSEKFIDDDDANTYLTRIYRPPYLLPDEV